MWDWYVSTAGPVLFIGLRCSIPLCPLVFFNKTLSVYRLVLWGWGLQTGRVYRSLSPGLALSAALNNNNNDNNKNNNNNKRFVHELTKINLPDYFRLKLLYWTVQKSIYIFLHLNIIYLWTNVMIEQLDIEIVKFLISLILVSINNILINTDKPEYVIVNQSIY